MVSICKELVGVDGDTAAATIKRENGNIESAIVVLEGTFVQEDFRCTRVWVNGSGIVTKTPINWLKCSQLKISGSWYCLSNISLQICIADKIQIFLQGLVSNIKNSKLNFNSSHHH
ncbi:hypothetical protein MKW98_020224 [Papaver atlanticum]|uniref:Uncharacterized protein n=1 Tax=Papaver atlanticum TaxID=357466 RepID=A0AAD4SAF3_9MAGN|nr:hypothetical protein MKW98_020224 [Papaver atlanticum]